MTTNSDLIRAERVVIDYNTQTHPGWILRDYIAEALREERERCARALDVLPGSYEIARAAAAIRSLD